MYRATQTQLMTLDGLDLARDCQSSRRELKSITDDPCRLKQLFCLAMPLDEICQYILKVHMQGYTMPFPD